ncbi:TRAP transporter substrate-binding protein (plasmid) [Pseudohalocynthiibacter aestuariivivens]|nr:TRAP transporter substrate-binding protein [Pseudohalocynthiibacter aestuariivivens]QIE48022.1 TRAP transporter substrate-binding protein [Pseudohalocynthiibacter aestuariivivens]
MKKQIFGYVKLAVFLFPEKTGEIAMKFKLNKWGASALSGLLFSAMQIGAASAQEHALRLAHYFPQDSYVHVAMERLADRVSKKSEGRVEITIFGGGSLGGDRELSEQVRLGGIQMANIGVPTQAPLDERFMIEELPYIWDSYQQIEGAYEGEFGEMISSIMVEHGARPLAFFPFGYRHMTNSKRPIRTPEDVKGLKMRTSDVPVRIDMFETLGAKPVPISFTELYTAMQQGVVDGQENPLFLILTSQFQEVQPNISLTGHILNSNQIIINEAYWQSLPDDVKSMLEAEVKTVGQEMAQATQEQEQNALEELKAQGIEVVEDVNRAAFREELTPLYAKYREQYGEEIWSVLSKYASLPAQ